MSPTLILILLLTPRDWQAVSQTPHQELWNHSQRDGLPVPPAQLNPVQAP